MEKIILSRDNIEKNREKILEAYAAPSKSSNKLSRESFSVWEETEEQQQLSTLELLPVR